HAGSGTALLAHQPRGPLALARAFAAGDPLGAAARSRAPGRTRVRERAAAGPLRRHSGLRRRVRNGLHPQRTVAFETFIGWRYLFRRGRRKSVFALFALSLIISVFGGVLFIQLTAAAHPGAMAPLTPVVAVIFGTLFAIVFGLLLLFSVFT